MIARLRHPRTTVRWRLTILYGGMFLVCGAVLLIVTYTLVDHATYGGNVTFGPRNTFIQAKVHTAGGGVLRLSSQSAPAAIKGLIASGHIPSPAFFARVQHVLQSSPGQAAVAIVGRNQRISDLHQLEVESVIALAIMAVLSGALGWVLAGRVLAPLRVMTATTQQISEANLNRRLAMDGPRDELRDLSDTIDGLLERMEGAFESQRRFVANASHELRTPLSSARALLELALSDPKASVASLRTTCEQVLEESEQQEQLIDALLALASSQQGLDARPPVDLSGLVGGIVGSRKRDAVAAGLRLSATLEDATAAGDARLIERMVSNLIDNAIRHNIPGGEVNVAVSATAGVPRVSVRNTGPEIAPDEVQRLTQPFQRLATDRTGHGEGLGLGLSIVSAIAAAHGATLSLTPVAGGGLHASVSFPAVDVAAAEATTPEPVAAT